MKSQIDGQVFPMLRSKGLCLSSVGLEESLIQDIINSAVHLYTKNTIGPEKYLNLYAKYMEFVNGNEQIDVAEFLTEKHDLNDFKEVNSLH